MDNNRTFSDILKGIQKQVGNAKIGSKALTQIEIEDELIKPLLKKKKNNSTRKIGLLLVENYFKKSDGVDNFTIAKLIKIKFNSTKNPKLTKKIYLGAKNKVFNDKIENRIRSLKNKWKPLGYTIKFNKHKSKIVKI